MSLASPWWSEEQMRLRAVHKKKKSSSSFNCWRHVSDVAEKLSPESDWVAIQMTLKVLLYAKFDEQQNRFYFLRKEEVTSTKPVWLASLAPLSVPLSWLHACFFSAVAAAYLQLIVDGREREKRFWNILTLNHSLTSPLVVFCRCVSNGWVFVFTALVQLIKNQQITSSDSLTFSNGEKWYWQ